MNDRDCDNCAHHSEGGCSVWECSFAQKDDTISRQAAIDAINKAFERVFAWDGTSPLGDKVLENVPSAHPVITCDGCRFVGTYDTDPPCRCCIRREKDYYEKE